jgi:hypothetical protein
MIGVIVLNPLKFDRIQQGSLAIAVVAFAYFVGHTIHLANNRSRMGDTQPQTESPAPILQESVSSPCSNIVAGGEVNVNCPPEPEKKNAPKPDDQ